MGSRANSGKSTARTCNYAGTHDCSLSQPLEIWQEHYLKIKLQNTWKHPENGSSRYLKMYLQSLSRKCICSHWAGIDADIVDIAQNRDKGVSANWTKPRPVSLAARVELLKILTGLQDRNIIEPSKSAWSSPIVLAQKKDGSLRSYVDYKKIN